MDQHQRRRFGNNLHDHRATCQSYSKGRGRTGKNQACSPRTGGIIGSKKKHKHDEERSVSSGGSFDRKACGAPRATRNTTRRSRWSTTGWKMVLGSSEDSYNQTTESSDQGWIGLCSSQPRRRGICDRPHTRRGKPCYRFRARPQEVAPSIQQEKTRPSSRTQHSQESETVNKERCPILWYRRMTARTSSK